jgi:gas vesicle protein
MRNSMVFIYGIVIATLAMTAAALFIAPRAIDRKQPLAAQS